MDISVHTAETETRSILPNWTSSARSFGRQTSQLPNASDFGVFNCPMPVTEIDIQGGDPITGFSNFAVFGPGFFRGARAEVSRVRANITARGDTPELADGAL